VCRIDGRRIDIALRKRLGRIGLEKGKKGGYMPGSSLMMFGNEPISAWQYYSKRARATLNIAGA
jgi:hypothetical protein